MPQEGVVDAAQPAAAACRTGARWWRPLPCGMHRVYTHRPLRETRQAYAASISQERCVYESIAPCTTRRAYPASTLQGHESSFPITPCKIRSFTPGLPLQLGGKLPVNSGVKCRSIQGQEDGIEGVRTAETAVSDGSPSSRARSASSATCSTC